MAYASPIKWQTARRIRHLARNIMVLPGASRRYDELIGEIHEAMRTAMPDTVLGDAQISQSLFYPGSQFRTQTYYSRAYVFWL